MSCPNIYPDPLVQGATAGAPANQASITVVQNAEGIHDLGGQGGSESAKSKQQDADHQWVGNEPEVGGTATATKSQIGPGVADPAKADAWLDLARAL